MNDWHLAQVNVARMQFPLEDERMHGFESRLDEINALAERSPGFIWRYADDSGSATNTRPLGDDVLINFSVWNSPEALKDYVYGSAHRDLLAGRREWFHPGEQRQLALWWWPVLSAPPSVDEALKRLARIQEHGPTAEAFTFGKLFDPPAAL